MNGDTTVSVSLAPELDRFVRDRVASGEYESASEVVTDGLRLLVEAESRDLFPATDALRTRLAESAAQAKRGELIDPSVLMAAIKERSRLRAAE